MPLILVLVKYVCAGLFLDFLIFMSISWVSKIFHVMMGGLTLVGRIFLRCYIFSELLNFLKTMFFLGKWIVFGFEMWNLRWYFITWTSWNQNYRNCAKRPIGGRQGRRRDLRSSGRRVNCLIINCIRTTTASLVTWWTKRARSVTSKAQTRNTVEHERRRCRQLQESSTWDVTRENDRRGG